MTSPRVHATCDVKKRQSYGRISSLSVLKELCLLLFEFAIRARQLLHATSYISFHVCVVRWIMLRSRYQLIVCRQPGDELMFLLVYEARGCGHVLEGIASGMSSQLLAPCSVKSMFLNLCSDFQVWERKASCAWFDPSRGLMSFEGCSPIQVFFLLTSIIK